MTHCNVAIFMSFKDPLVDLIYEKHSVVENHDDGQTIVDKPSLWRYRIIPSLHHVTQIIHDRKKSGPDQFALLRTFCQKVYNISKLI